MGLEDLYVRGGSAYWVVEKQGTFVDTDVREIYIGTVSGESIELSAEFGGGSISVAAAKALTARHVYLSGATGAGARLAIRDSLAGVAVVNRKSVTAAAAQGFAQGARVGAEGFGEGATFGLVQASDWAKSQPEFALSRNIGTGTTLLAGVVLSAGSAAAVTGGTTLGTAMPSTTVTSGALSLGTGYASGELGAVILADTGLVLAWSASNKPDFNVATDLDPVALVGTWMYGVQQHLGRGSSPSGRPTTSSGRLIGPSGRPMIHAKLYTSRKEAKDAARQRKGAIKAVHGTAHKKGRDHFHAVDEDDKRIDDGMHYEHP
jgi:hypothetical protein